MSAVKTERIQLLVTVDLGYTTTIERGQAIRRMCEMVVGPSLYGGTYRAETKSATLLNPTRRARWAAKLKALRDENADLRRELDGERRAHNRTASRLVGTGGYRP